MCGTNENRWYSHFKLGRIDDSSLTLSRFRNKTPFYNIRKLQIKKHFQEGKKGKQREGEEENTCNGKRWELVMRGWRNGWQWLLSISAFLCEILHQVSQAKKGSLPHPTSLLYSVLFCSVLHQSLLITYITYIHIYIFDMHLCMCIYIYHYVCMYGWMCVCVCVCVCVRERERERERDRRKDNVLPLDLSPNLCRCK